MPSQLKSDFQVWEDVGVVVRYAKGVSRVSLNSDFMRTIADVTVYDPITKRTFTGKQSWCEVAVDYITWGDTVYGLPIDDKTPVKYWVHGIDLDRGDASHPNFPFKKAQPVLIQTKDESLSGVIDTFTLETERKIEGPGYTFSLTVVPIDMLTFVELIHNLQENYYEHKIKETPSESGS